MELYGLKEGDGLERTIAAGISHVDRRPAEDGPVIVRKKARVRKGTTALHVKAQHNGKRKGAGCSGCSLDDDLSYVLTRSRKMRA